MAWTQTDLDNVEAAIVTAAVAGFAEIQVSGFTGRRYSLTELIALRNAMRGAVTTSDRFSIGGFSKE